MNARSSLAMLASLLAGSAVAAEAVVYRDRAPQIVVETKDCTGETGLATFHPDRVHQIRTGPCPNPDATSEPLKQVFLRNAEGSGSYEIVWVDEAGAQSILEQLKENRAAALERASGTRKLIID